MATFKFLLCFTLVHIVAAKGSDSKVECTSEVMKVTVPIDGDRNVAYLDRLKEYKPCLPQLEDNVATFVLDLQDPHKCGVTRVLNTMTGRKTFYHKIIIEDTSGGREVVTARCMVTGKLRALTKRAVDPLLEGPINEPDVVEIVSSPVIHAPEPNITAIVKQNGKILSGEVFVNPGTPLTFEIVLDSNSAPIYGLLVSYMQVTDTGKQQETIILNGCSVDPYLFDNFLTTNGDLLTAKFKAFKFPDTAYVQFKGTVTVCLDKCQGVPCSNGVTAFGRKRREVSTGHHSNNIYEVALTTFIKVDWINGEKKAEDVLAHLKNLKVANQKLGQPDDTPTVDEIAEVETLVSEEISNKSNTLAYCSIFFVISLILTLLK